MKSNQYLQVSGYSPVVEKNLPEQTFERNRLLTQPYPSKLVASSAIFLMQIRTHWWRLTSELGGEGNLFLEVILIGHIFE